MVAGKVPKISVQADCMVVFHILLRIVILITLFLTVAANPIKERKFDSWFRDYTLIHFGTAVSPAYPKAVAISESALKIGAVSWVGAQGMMQFMPATWADVAPEPWKTLGPFDPEAAIFVGIKYLKWLWDKFPVAVTRHRKALASASYNSGLGNIYKARKSIRRQGRKETTGYDSYLILLSCDPDKWDSPDLEDYLVTNPSAQKETRAYIRRIRQWEKKLFQAGYL